MLPPVRMRARLSHHVMKRSANCRLVPNVDATAEDLAAIGVTSWKLNADIYETDPELGQCTRLLCHTIWVWLRACELGIP